MDYIGSKDKLNTWIFDKVKRHFPDGGVFLDGCCGSGSVSRAAAANGYRVISNDLLTFPSYIVKGSIGLQHHWAARDFIDQMNKMAGVEGFFYANYSPAGGRMYFTEENAKKIDACRQFLDDYPVSHCISSTSSQAHSEHVRSYLMYCLLEAVSRVSNTAGTHGAYLKDFKARAKEPIEIRNEPFIKTDVPVTTYTGDILHLLSQDNGEDILYLDPPYNQRQYASNYHLYETLVRYDNPEVSGKTGLRDYSEQKSDFCSRAKVLEFTKKVLESTKARLVLLSYSSDGTMKLHEMEDMMCSLAHNGEVSVHVKTQRRYKADNDRNNDDTHLREYLFEFVRDQSIL